MRAWPLQKQSTLVGQRESSRTLSKRRCSSSPSDDGLVAEAEGEHVAHNYLHAAVGIGVVVLVGVTVLIGIAVFILIGVVAGFDAGFGAAAGQGQQHNQSDGVSF
jgi:hypothetical protein